MAEAEKRARRGRQAHFIGLMAEDVVARWYERRDGAIEARRWRAPEGEIDLVVRTPEALVFVEVKAGAGATRRDCVSERQWRRLERAALRYSVETETGETPLRFDAAFLGPDGAVAVVENARGFD